MPILMPRRRGTGDNYLEINVGMASVDMPENNSGPMTVLQLQKGCVQFHTPTSGVVAVPPRCLTQSKLLQSLAENTDGDDEAQVPITPAALQLWLHHVQSTDDVITTDQEQDTDVDGRSGHKSDDIKSAQLQPHEQSSGGDPATSPTSNSSLQHILTLITVRSSDGATTAHDSAVSLSSIPGYGHCACHYHGRIPTAICADARLVSRRLLTS